LLVALLLHLSPTLLHLLGACAHLCVILSQLVAGKIEISEPFHPAVLKFCLAGSRGALGRNALWLTLLGVGAERHCERDR